MMRNQRGVTIPMLAVFMVVLFAMAALAIDLGVLYTARTSAQHAADAAALAGAYTFLEPLAPQPDTAIDAAISVAAKNKVLGTSITIDSSNVNVETSFRRVTVTVPRTAANGVETFFAKVIGLNKVDVLVRATAEAATNGNATRCLKPFYMPNTILSPSGQGGCSTNPKEIIFDPTTTPATITQWATNTGKLGGDTWVGLTPANPQQAFAPSQFYALDFGSGANTYRCSIGNCLGDCGVDTTVINCGAALPLETGRMVGPTEQGVNDLIGNPPDTWNGLLNGVYTFLPGGGGDPRTESRSLITVPVWDNCAQPFSPGTHGQSVNVIGFLEAFVDGMQGTTVKVHLIQPIACNVAGGTGNTGSNTGPLSVPVRLVNMQ